MDDEAASHDLVPTDMQVSTEPVQEAAVRLVPTAKESEQIMFDKLVPDVLSIIENNLDDIHYSQIHSQKIFKIPRHADNQTVRSHVQRFKKYMIRGMPVNNLDINHLSI
jgi:hypothetical protein